MRKFTFLLAAMIVVSSMLASTAKTALLFRSKKMTAQTEEIYSLNPKENKQISLLKKKTANPLWKPLAVDTYFADEETGQWLEEMSVKFTYDSKGNLLTENDGYSVFTFKYNENNKVIERIEQSIQEQGNLVNAEKKTYQYDPEVKDLIINQAFYLWDETAQEWKEYYNHKRDVVRNNEKKVLSMVLSLRDQQTLDFIPLEKTEVELNESGIASKITFFNVSETGSLREEHRLESITWFRTDGQIVAPFGEFMIGNNRIRKAIYFFQGQPYGTIETSYNEEKPSSQEFDMTIASIDSSEIEKHDLVLLDDNGSFKESISVLQDGEPIQDGYMIIQYDTYKNMIEEAYYDNLEVADTQVDGLICEYTYLEDTDKVGVVKECITSLFDGVEDYLPFLKDVYADFVDVTLGLNNLPSVQISTVLNNGLLSFNAVDGAVYKIYNVNGQVVLQGVATSDKMTLAVSDLSNGIYLLSVEGVGRAKLIK